MWGRQRKKFCAVLLNVLECGRRKYATRSLEKACPRHPATRLIRFVTACLVVIETKDT
jgi:hypothetical protein